MSPQGQLEQRVSSLEREVARLKSQFNVSPSTSDWVEEISGAFEGDERFREILRLGSEERDAQQDDDSEA